ncbi:CorA metal ion transporter [Madurella fahalii]|uniref:CorA metal ion transporter n=1 Tax=Madurella fahalii TaxID=1157608 RepID=A0ABQ0FXX5_9PEZI
MGSSKVQKPPDVPSATLENPLHPASASHAPRRRKNHRGGKKKKTRRKSFALPPDEIAQDSVNSEAFYARPNHNLSATSIESEALLDHRGQQPFLRPRRPSMMTANASFPLPQPGTRSGTARGESGDEEDDEGAPLLSSPVYQRSETFGGYGSNEAPRRAGPDSRRNSSRASSKKKLLGPMNEAYNVNYPPSVPGTPSLRPSDRMDMSFGDILLRDELESGQRSPRGGADQVDNRGGFQPSPLERRKTIALQAEEDVCFPQEGLSDIADDELAPRDPAAHRIRARRRRGKWPDLSILDEWSRFEKEGRSEERRVKKITEPQLINGRLRPVNRGWFQAEEEAPYRFTYFNEEFRSTIHSQTISELVQPGGTFKELFIPDPPLLSDSSEDEAEDGEDSNGLYQVLGGQIGDPKIPSRQPSLATTTQDFAERKHSGGSDRTAASTEPKHDSEDHTPSRLKSPGPDPFKSPEQGKAVKPPRYGDRPVWWLDILSPTEAEMKVISKAFGIHPLTAEDIMMQEQREKVELFRNYYFVNYRSFDQDHTSKDFLEPVNMYVVVFREGVLSFHFSVTPHPANVRRRIRQLRDYLILSSDWISYAIIDDITDVFGPLIQNIEDEVDDIDYAILQMHSPDDQAQKDRKRENSEKPDLAEPSSAEAGRDMLRRVGDCRKKVMSLYRLLGNKADVIKGFAKRCNEHWEVAPRSEIGLYLGDIQDHIVTMTSNLSHYEKILARSHGNYLAQINLRMNERQEQTADVLGKLTVLGTIVLPMNIITGLWGMNVWVPGQEYEGDLKWFFAITGALLLFGLTCYWTAKRVYNIV